LCGFGPFGEADSVAAVEGGTEALGATISFFLCLLVLLSSVGAGPGGTDAMGVANGGAFASGFFLLSGAVGGLIAGLTEAEAPGTGGSLSRLSLSLPFSLRGATEAVADVTGVVLAAEAGVAVAGGAAGDVAAGLAAVVPEVGTVGGGTLFGSSFLIFSFNSACALGSPIGSHPRSTGA
jgi:hypothetical protein